MIRQNDEPPARNVTKPIRFKGLIVPQLVLLLLGLLTQSACGEVAFRKEDGRLHITVDGQPLAVYVWNDPTTTRPYFMDLHAAGGKIQLTRNHPPADGDIDDHATFHPGLWWGFGDVGGNDYWRLKARAVGGDFVEAPRGGQTQGHFAVRNRLLVNGDDATFCEQICRYTILQRARGILLVCESTLRREAGDFWLGDQEEMGLALRVATPLAMASNQGGRIVNSLGSRDLKQIRTRQSDWCDYSGPIAGQHGGMLLMNDPGNFRKPWWHAVETGLLIANPLGESELNGRGKKRQNVLVQAGEPFRLRYGVLLHLEPDAAAFDAAAAYDDFLEVLGELKSEDLPANDKQSRLPRVPDGFQVSIYAREPLVYKPTSLCFDARGRLFVGQGPQYPRNNQDSPTDSVQLLIDADHDGTADEARVFADGFNSIQGLAWKGNDLYVANAPELTLVRDNDGDDRADEYVVIFTDLGNREHALHGLNFGPDGKLYMSKGNSKGHNQPDKYGYVAPRPFRELWDVEHPPGAPDAYPPQTFTRETYRKTYHHWDDDWGREGGVLRCDPLGENLEIVARGLRNPWDIALDDGFDWLGTDNDQTQGDRIVMPFYGAHFGWGHRYSSHWTGAGNLPTVPVSGPLFSGSGSGIIYYAHDHFPPAYRHVFFINDWLLGTFVYRPAWHGALRMPAGGSWQPFMRRSAQGVLYRPTDLEFGPDGSIYTLGWGGDYHYDAGQEGSWIFRITHRAADRLDSAQPDSAQPDSATPDSGLPRPLAEQSVPKLLASLGPEVLPARRVNAQDELVRRGPAIHDEVVTAISAAGLSTGQQTWAVWALGRIEGNGEELTEMLRKWVDPRERAPRNLRIQALRILGYRARRFDDQPPLRAALPVALADADPRIRMAAIQAAHQARVPGAVSLLIEQLARETDRVVFYAGWQALRALAPGDQRRLWLDHSNARVRLAVLLGLQEDFALTQDEAWALVDRETDPAVQSWALTFALNPRPPKKMPNTTARVVLEQTIPVGQIIQRARAAADRPTLRNPYLRMIARGSIRGGAQQQELLDFYRTLKTEQERALVLPATATTMSAVPDLWEALAGGERLQQAAIQGFQNLVNLRTSGLRAAEQPGGSTSRSRSSGDAQEIANRLLDLLVQVAPGDRRLSGTLSALNEFPLPPDWTVSPPQLEALLEILEHTQEPSIRRLAARLLIKLDPGPVAAHPRTRHVLVDICRVPSAHLYHELLALVAHLGLELQVAKPAAATPSGVLDRLAAADIERGQTLFFDPVRGARCAACHRVRGRGSALAPDLSGVGLRLTPENMVKAIFQPSATITEGYQTRQLVLSDGRTYSGAVVRETDTAITLLRTDGTQVTVEVATIDQQQKVNQSVMPKGYELFGDEQLADLIAWLLTLRDGAGHLVKQ